MAADIELTVGADFTELKREIDRARAKFNDLKQSNELLKQEVKEVTQSLRNNDSAIAKVNKELAKLSPSTREGAAQMRKLKVELEGLNTQNSAIQNTLRNSKLELEKSTEALKKQGAELRKMENAGSGFSKGATKVYSSLRLIANIIPGLGIGTLVGIIAGPLVNAFGSWLGLTGEVAEKQKKLAEYTDKAVGELSKEVSQITQLVAVGKDDSRSKEERFAAIKKLQEIAPQYFSNLDAEKSGVEELTRAHDKYLGSLKQRLRLEINKSALDDNLKEQILLDDKIEKSQLKQADNEKKIAELRRKATKAFKDGDIQTYQSLNAQITGLQQDRSIKKGITNKLKEDLSKLKQEAGKLLGKVTKDTVFTGIDDVYNKLSAQLEKFKNQEINFGTNEAQKKIEALKEAITSLTNDFGLQKSDPRIQSLLKMIEYYEKAIPVTKKYSSAIKSNAKEIETVDSVLRRMNESLANSTTLEKVFGDDRTKEKINAISKAIEELVIKLKVTTDSDLILKLKKQIADLETSQKIDFKIEVNTDLLPLASKLSDNSKFLDSISAERKDLIKKIRKMGFDKLPIGVGFDNATTEDLRKFFDDITNSITNSAYTITSVLGPAFDQMFDAIFKGEDAFEALKNGIQGIIQDLIKAA
ncbi:MAG: hypothetical protein LC100_11325, partial [Chitinophagales bacterium]|nr:hypothetical protein [Chitinophagales bacterium]